MKINKDRIENINSILLIVYMYLSTLTLPIKEITNSGLIVWLVTGIIILISFFNNSFRVNIKIILLVLFFAVLFSINYLIVDYKDEVIHIFVEFAKFGVVPLYLASFIKDYKILLKKWYLFSVFVLLIWLIFLGEVNSRELNYMTFGRHMTLSFIIFTIYFYINVKKKTNLFLMIVCLTLITFFANRSSLLICLIILILFEFRSFKNRNVLLNYLKSIAYIFLAVVFVLKLENIVYWLRDILQEIGINSYVLTKLVFAFRSGLDESLSGRDTLAMQTIELITAKNFMPNGIGYFQHVTGIVYPHNFILEILVIFGWIGILVLLVIFVLSIFKYVSLKEQNQKVIIFVLFVYVFVRLSFSGSFWSEEQFWILVGLFLTSKSENGINRKKVLEN